MFLKTIRLFIAVLFLSSVTTFTAHAHGQSIAIMVSRDGFDRMSNYSVDVEAGHEVTITFTYADDDLTGDNPHDIRILGAGVDLPTVTVSRDNPTASITFTPTRTGTLTILCVIPCIGMENLVGGSIHVVQPFTSGAKISLTLDLSPRDEQSVLARVKLTDAEGRPISDVPVSLVLNTSVGGEIVVGVPVTVVDGTAAWMIPALAGQKLQVSAVFQGGNGLGYAQNIAEITMPGAPLSVPLGALSSPAPPFALALMLVIVVGSIWVTFGFVAYQVFSIRKG